MTSIEHIEYLVRSYGYWALFIGTFLEGETILIIGGLLAKLGLLNLSTVMMVAFIGSFTGDQLYFYIGYFKGQEVLSKHPKWRRRVDRVHKVIERYRTLIMLGFRFVYGMRIMTPFVIGLDRQVNVARFSILNAIGAVVWSIAIAAGGYFFGYAVEGFVKDVKKYELHVILAISAIGVILWIIHKYRSNKTLNGK
ncbi:MAG: Inner membrane protein YohD [Syntrophus sp. SKADARSKE-3]|nr:Inner membrane protein YohD [Syntrophus sp. SKADARSKE-3]